MRLRELAGVDSDSEVTGFALDHRRVAPGSVFGAFRGSVFNGEDFVPQAVDRGAVAVVARPEAVVEKVPHLADSEPRGLFAFSRDGFLPRALAAVHPKYHTPHRVILIYGLVVAIIAVTDTALGGTFERLAVFANLAALILYFLCAIAAWNLRRRNIRSEGEPFVTPGGPLVPIAACLSIAWLFSETADRGQIIALGIVLAIIFVPIDAR